MADRGVNNKNKKSEKEELSGMVFFLERFAIVLVILSWLDPGSFFLKPNLFVATLCFLLSNSIYLVYSLNSLWNHYHQKFMKDGKRTENKETGKEKVKLDVDLNKEKKAEKAKDGRSEEQIQSSQAKQEGEKAREYEEAKRERGELVTRMTKLQNVFEKRLEDIYQRVELLLRKRIEDLLEQEEVKKEIGELGTRMTIFQDVFEKKLEKTHQRMELLVKTQTEEHQEDLLKLEEAKRERGELVTRMTKLDDVFKKKLEKTHQCVEQLLEKRIEENEEDLVEREEAKRERGELVTRMTKLEDVLEKNEVKWVKWEEERSQHVAKLGDATALFEFYRHQLHNLDP